MNSILVSIFVIAMLTAISCVLPGVFLVLRGVALMSDAISHAILLGIVGMFLIVQNLHSPLLIVGAALAGLLTVFCTQLLIKTQRLKEDAAIGLVFPFFFSLGVILISMYARNVHLDVDMVLLGEIVFAPFNTVSVYGVNLGPLAMWVLSGVLIINALFIALFFKELTITIFDPNLAATMRISSTGIFYALMSLTSITAVAAFDIVGSVVVVALMITPAATAYLISNRVPKMVFLSLFFGIISAFFGCLCAVWLDVSIAGSIACVTGLLFLFVLLFTFFKDKEGAKQNRAIELKILCNYIERQRGFATAELIKTELNWSRSRVKLHLDEAQKRGLIYQENGDYSVTPDVKRERLHPF